VLRPLQNMFDPADYPDLLIGLDGPDDAAVYRLDNDRALIVTTDFFTPIVDDPYDYGAIAAANSLSDVYAMGGQPILALNIAALPPDLPIEMMTTIFRGSAEKVRESGAVLAGGHTIQDKEPKLGLVVVGFAHPEKIMSKSGARPGDALILSKPLGTGTITTALKREEANPEHVRIAVDNMAKLNRHASELGVKYGVRGATDITGFGFLGHAIEMAEGAKARFVFDFDKIPFLPGTLHYADKWMFPGGAFNNKSYYGPHVKFSPALGEERQMLLFDPQTSGGLLMAVRPHQADDLLSEANQAGPTMWLVGQVTEGQGIEVQA